MNTHIQLCLWALAVLWQFKTISRINRLKLWCKSQRLFLCFFAFTDEERPKEQLLSAMKCALLSALYDYETDWIAVQNTTDSIFLKALREYVPDANARRLAEMLFEADLHTNLSKDGLERGSIALTFYSNVIASRWLNAITPEQITAHGRSLQVLDDVWDLEKDRAAGHTNSLLTEQRIQYIAELRDFFETDFYRRLERSSISYRKLRHAAEACMHREEVMTRARLA